MTKLQFIIAMLLICASCWTLGYLTKPLFNSWESWNQTGSQSLGDKQ